MSKRISKPGWIRCLEHLVEDEQCYCNEMSALNEADEEMNASILADFNELKAMLPVIKAAPDLLAAIRSLQATLRSLEDWRELDATLVDQLIASDGLALAAEAIQKASDTARQLH